VGDDVLVDSKTLLVTDFMNLKIEVTHFFGCTHKDRMCVIIWMSAYIYMSIYVSIVVLTKYVLSCVL
jgi:hypothetical protein